MFVISKRDFKRLTYILNEIALSISIKATPNFPWKYLLTSNGSIVKQGSKEKIDLEIICYMYVS